MQSIVFEKGEDNKLWIGENSEHGIVCNCFVVWRISQNKLWERENHHSIGTIDRGFNVGILAVLVRIIG